MVPGFCRGIPVPVNPVPLASGYLAWISVGVLPAGIRCPRAFIGQGEGLPVPARRPRKRAEAGCRSELAWSERHKSPLRELGDCDLAHQLATARLKRGGVCSRSPRARAQGFYWAKGRGCPCQLAGLASERRQDAEAKLAWSERRQDAEANVRRDGTGNPDPRKGLHQVPARRPRKRAKAGCRSEREARWHGQPRPTHDVTHANPYRAADFPCGQKPRILEGHRINTSSTQAGRSGSRSSSV